MTPEERNYSERGRLLLHASEHETDPTLALVLATQSERVYMKAIHLQMERKQETRKALGLSLTV